MRPIWRVLLYTVVPFMGLLVGIRREGSARVPRDGAFIIAPNHTSNIDPIVMGIAVFKAGRTPHFLGKASLWTVPVVRALLRATGQIPVERGGSRGDNALGAAARNAERGSGVIIYPEGTLTRDPATWPMRGKTGAVRLALAEGIPLIPVAHWGTERFLPAYSPFLRLIPRVTIRVRFGEPLDLSRFDGRAVDAAVLTEATDQLMTAITALVAEMRGESAPAERWDPAKHGQSEFGHP
jgi:1-acyl-sn-glycerol-3-phosphate acyltransferase